MMIRLHAMMSIMMLLSDPMTFEEVEAYWTQVLDCVEQLPPGKFEDREKIARACLRAKLLWGNALDSWHKHYLDRHPHTPIWVDGHDPHPTTSLDPFFEEITAAANSKKRTTDEEADFIGPHNSFRNQIAAGYKGEDERKASYHQLAMDSLTKIKLQGAVEPWASNKIATSLEVVHEEWGWAHYGIPATDDAKAYAKSCKRVPTRFHELCQAMFAWFDEHPNEVQEKVATALGHFCDVVRVAEHELRPTRGPGRPNEAWRARCIEPIVRVWRDLTGADASFWVNEKSPSRKASSVLEFVKFVWNGLRDISLKLGIEPAFDFMDVKALEHHCNKYL